jgi:di/tricarboxylate transporter
LYKASKTDINTLYALRPGNSPTGPFRHLARAILLLYTEWIRIDLVALLIILALSFTGVFEPGEAFIRVRGEPAIILAPLLFSAGHQIFTDFLSAQSTHHLIAFAAYAVSAASIIFFLNERPS